MGEPQTAVDVQPEAAAKAKAERGEKTAENIRYGRGWFHDNKLWKCGSGGLWQTAGQGV
jgi:hypothetical protein